MPAADERLLRVGHAPILLSPQTGVNVSLVNR
ncbi:hypothetical protein STSP_39950 [Streptomyces jeddahensis]|uniref:Uncharacterized protein n=1 Tax=Streptomyces jeddahensis TaxID=1716141 RepID=A0A177HPW7_9ACTN|nr:hypothetical protein STSP_39950 [Streptomyces jeddahensis]